MNTKKGNKVVNSIIVAVLVIVACLTLYPFIYVLSASISSGQAVVSGKVLFLPYDINFEAYKKVFSDSQIWIAYGNTIYYTVVGTAVNLFFTICGAYPLSKKRLMGGSAIAFFVAFTMWFNAGLVPMYLNFKDLNLLDTRLSIIIGFAISAFLVFILRTFFQTIPSSLEESAKMDGANDLQILWKIYLPLSKPGLVTVGLFYAVTRWDGYFWAMVLLKDEVKIPLQVLLKNLIVDMTSKQALPGGVDLTAMYSQQVVIYAIIVISIIPVIAVYPFLLKYFDQGAMIGSIKE